MRGYVADAKTKKTKIIEDGLPFPEYPPHVEPEPLRILTDEQHDAILCLLEQPSSITPVKNVRIALEILLEAVVKYDRKES